MKIINKKLNYTQILRIVWRFYTQILGIAELPSIAVTQRSEVTFFEKNASSSLYKQN